MISALIDKLREMADQLQEHGTFVGYGGTTNTDPLMHGAAIVMRDAADTIWQLRDDLQRANDAVLDAEHDESRAWDRVRKAEAENAKLRELVRDMWKGCPADGYYCIYHCPRYDKTSESHCKLYDRMKKLGIEV